MPPAGNNPRPAPGRPVPATANRPDPFRLPGLDPDEQTKALTGATVTLTQHVATLTGAVGRATAALAAQRVVTGSATLRPTGPDAGKGVAGSPGVLSRLLGGITGTLTALGMKIIAPLAPLAILGQILGMANSGFGAFLSTTRLLTASLAGLLLPALTVASGVVFALALELKDPLIGAIGGFANSLEGTLGIIEGLSRLAEDLGVALDDLGIDADLSGSALGYLTEQARAAGVSMADLVRVLTPFGMGGAVGDKIREALGLPQADSTTAREERRARRRRRGETGEAGPDDGLPGVPLGEAPGGVLGAVRALGGVPLGRAPVGKTPLERVPLGEVPTAGMERAPLAAPGATGAGAFMDSVMKGMDLSLRQIERDLSPQAQRSSIADAYKNAQMAALNVDPIARETLDVQRDTLMSMRELLNEVKQRLTRPTTH